MFTGEEEIFAFQRTISRPQKCRLNSTGMKETEARSNRLLYAVNKTLWQMITAGRTLYYGTEGIIFSSLIMHFVLWTIFI